MTKVGSFGERYGDKVRQRWLEHKRDKAYDCPRCHKKGVKRQAAGIWNCSKCGLKFAGKAYKPA